MREYLTVFLVAATVTYLLGVLAREVALRTGAVAKVRDRDVHAVPIPYFGGVAMLGGLLAAYVVAGQLPFLSLSSNDAVFRDARVVLLAGSLVCLLGVLDDLIELDALTKLGGQLLAAGLLVVFDVYYYSFQIPGGGQFVPDPLQAQLVSVVIVVATINAVNFVDGLDGLASGVVGIGAVAFFAFSYKLADANEESLAITAALLCAALGGACVGFLPHNFFPARIFMGDSGSMLIGLVLVSAMLSNRSAEMQTLVRAFSALVMLALLGVMGFVFWTKERGEIVDANDAGALWLVEEMPSAVDAGSNRIIAKLPHFSLFTLGWP